MTENNYIWNEREPMLFLDEDDRNVAEYLRDLKEVYQREKTELSDALHRYISHHVKRKLFKLTDNIIYAKRKILEEKYP